MPFPVGVSRVLPVQMAFSEPPALLSGGGEASALSVLVHWGADPVVPGVPADRLVTGVDQDNLVVLVDAILVDPVRVQDAQVAAPSADPLFGSGLKGSPILELVHTLVGWLAVHNTLLDRSLPTTTTDPNSVDDEALLGLIAEAARLIGTRRTGCAVDDMQLAILPAPDAK